MRTWLEGGFMAFLVGTAGLVIWNNPWGLDRLWQILCFVSILVFSYIVALFIDKMPVRKPRNDPAREPSRSVPIPADGIGGRGGGGNAVGKDSVVLGGRGGRGGLHGAGRGGDGGGGDAVGAGSMVIGGDGGDAGRIDGRGGKGGASPLKRLSPEELNSWGLTGNEGYGQGGAAANSSEYDRSLRVLTVLSAEYVSKNPTGTLSPMPGVSMPPVDWVNSRLSEMGESFHVELIDMETDFILQPNLPGD